MKSFISRVVEAIQERGPAEVCALATWAEGNSKVARRSDTWAGARLILEAVRRGECGLKIVEYPTYRLKSRFPETMPRGRYICAAVDVLSESRRALGLDELTARYTERYQHAAVVPEFWMWKLLQTRANGLVIRQGQLKIGLDRTTPLRPAVKRPGRSEAGLQGRDAEPFHAKISEENLESLIVERLEEVEPGLTLVSRQYVTPVGRIDLLCKDRRGNLVVIELKRFRASTDSIIDQVTRYMGWVKEHVARPPATVRACIIVGRVDKKLEYSVRAIPNLTAKCLRVTLIDPD